MGSSKEKDLKEGLWCGTLIVGEMEEEEKRVGMSVIAMMMTGGS